MMRYFNTEGQCDPELHYMVKLDDRLEKIKCAYIEAGKYFVINRGRQYGKTTTLYALADYLKADYIVVSMDFQGISSAEYEDEYAFTQAFIRLFAEALEECKDVEEIESMIGMLGKPVRTTMGEMFSLLVKICKISPKPMIVMIDEVDAASNNKVFVDFLSQLRMYYMRRKRRTFFQSVILAGVYEIKNLQLKIRPEEEHQYNSPWNIAASFDMDMGFSAEQIAGMLYEYEADHKTGMDVRAIAGEIYQYTSGYPYLISAICKFISEQLADKNILAAWTKEGIRKAVNYILKENIPLFGSMIRHVGEYPAMRRILYDILLGGESVTYNPDNRAIGLAGMFGYVKSQEGNVQIANRIFETRLYDYFLSEEELANAMSSISKQDRNQFVCRTQDMAWKRV